MTEDLTTILRGANPVGSGELSDEAVAVLSSRMAREAVRVERVETARRRRARRRTRLVALALSGAVAVPATAWAANRFLAQTGTFGSFGTEPGVSEYIDLCAPDLPASIQTLDLPDGPLPSGHTWPKVMEQTILDYRQAASTHCSADGGLIEQAAGIRMSMLFEAQLLWSCEGIKKDRVNDTAGVLAAGQGVAFTFDEMDRSGVMAGDSWRDLRDRAAEGDIEVLRSLHEANATEPCS